MTNLQTDPFQIKADPYRLPNDPFRPTSFWREATSLPKLESITTTLRTMVINIGFIAVFILMLPSVASQFTRNQVVIEPIVVPAAIASQGLKPDVVANRLWDGLTAFAADASVARASVVTIPNSQVVQFSLPTAGFSIDSLFAQVRQFLGIFETRISGELVCATPDCAREGLKLRLRVTKGSAEVIDLPPMGGRSERDYFREAAAGVFSVLDPFVAIAAMAETEPLRATVLARQLVRSGHPDAKWAHNLIGDIAFSNGDIETAAAEFRAALAIDPAFSIAEANLGFALLALGDVDAARAAFTAVEARDPNGVESAEGFAAIALAAGSLKEAVSLFVVAAQRDPLEPEHLVQAGQYAFEAGDIESAETHLRDALAIDPGDSNALRILGDHYLRTGRRPAAEKLYRDWADYDPDSAPARFALGNVRLASRDYQGALAYYDEAVALGDTTPETQAARAEALRGLGRTAEADAVMAALPAASP
jgi:tetratricopeptide (TPR) repeat protein